MRKKISIISPAFNEEANIRACYEQVKGVMECVSDKYDYEHIFADNCSMDNTLAILRGIAAGDSRVKVLAYSRNFGGEKSGVTLYRHCTGEAAICVVSDLQDPPELIPHLLEKWEEGNEIVYGVYENRTEGWLVRVARKAYYLILDRMAEDKLPRNHSGFGLFDRRVLEEALAVEDHAPYFRGLIASVGFRSIEVPYVRSGRTAGASKHGWNFLLGFGMNALISYSLVPLRMATFLGITLSGLSFVLATVYAIIKLVNWKFQAPGATTIVVLVLFFSGIQLFFMGILGEYIGAIHAQVRRKPFVVIREKINF